jgi:siroheme synthase-like protein
MRTPDSLRFLPVGLDLRGARCLVVGGGNVGTRKVETLVRAGAHVSVVAPRISEALAAQVDAGRVRWVQESFREQHLDRAFLAVAATDDDTLNAAIVRAAAQVGALACDASSAERSQVIFGALLQHDDVTVAVFTDGNDPARARATRDHIADLVARSRERK